MFEEEEEEAHERRELTPHQGLCQAPPSRGSWPCSMRILDLSHTCQVGTRGGEMGEKLSLPLSYPAFKDARVYPKAPAHQEPHPWDPGLGWAEPGRA